MATTTSPTQQSPVPNETRATAGKAETSIEATIRRAQSALIFVDESDAVAAIVESGVDNESAFLAVVAARILNETAVAS